MASACKRVPLGTAGVRVNLQATECNAAGVPTVISIAAGTAFQVFFASPDGLLLVRAGDLTGDGSDGIFGYTLQAGDLTLPGVWRVQGSFELPAGTGPFPTSIVEFEVFRNLYPLNLIAPSPAALALVAPSVASI